MEFDKILEMISRVHQIAGKFLGCVQSDEKYLKICEMHLVAANVAEILRVLIS